MSTSRDELARLREALADCNTVSTFLARVSPTDAWYALKTLLAAAEERNRLLGEVVNAADRNRAADMVIADLERTLRQERDNVVTLGGALVDRDETISTLRAEVERLRLVVHDAYDTLLDEDVCGEGLSDDLQLLADRLLAHCPEERDAKAREGGGRG